MGTEVEAPVRRKSVDPEYPAEARRGWIQGTVALDIVIGSNGKVEDVAIVRSVPLLDDAAIEAVRQWEYHPAVIEGRAVPVVMTVGLGFSLPGAEDWVIDPEGEALLRLDDFFLNMGLDGSRTYSGTIRNLGPGALYGLEAVVSYLGEGSKGESQPPRDIEPPVKQKNISPLYPELARGRVQGTVVAETIVDERGSVGDLRILRSIPPLDPAVIEAVRQWQYEPARRDGVAVPFLVTASVEFRREGIDVSEYIVSEIGRVVVSPILDLQPGESREFSISLPPPETGRYFDVRLRFVVDEGGRRRDVPTSRQKKTITS